jgi:hypothetical protein
MSSEAALLAETFLCSGQKTFSIFSPLKVATVTATVNHMRSLSNFIRHSGARAKFSKHKQTDFSAEGGRDFNYI